MYLDQTYGPLRLDDMTLWMEHFKAWPAGLPIAAHAEVPHTGSRGADVRHLRPARAHLPCLDPRGDPADPRRQGARPEGHLRSLPSPPLP
jgi:hypothetical protein